MQTIKTGLNSKVTFVARLRPLPQLEPGPRRVCGRGRGRVRRWSRLNRRAWRAADPAEERAASAEDPSWSCLPAERHEPLERRTLPSEKVDGGTSAGGGDDAVGDLCDDADGDEAVCSIMLREDSAADANLYRDGEDNDDAYATEVA